MFIFESVPNEPLGYKELKLYCKLALITWLVKVFLFLHNLFRFLCIEHITILLLILVPVTQAS